MPASRIVLSVAGLMLRDACSSAATQDQTSAGDKQLATLVSAWGPTGSTNGVDGQ